MSEPESEAWRLEEQVSVVFATCWNRLDFTLLESCLADDVVYESQSVFDALRGLQAVMEYLKGKAKTIQSKGPASRVFAELATMEHIWPGKPCVLLAQGSRDDKLALVLFEVASGRVKRIDLCTAAPLPADARGSGVYPD